MTKIGAKLLFGSLMFVSLLILHTVLGQMTSRQAKESYTTLTQKTAPTVRLLTAIGTDKTELFLLLANRVVDNNHQGTSKQVEQVAIHDLPLRLAKMTDLKRSLEPTDDRNKHIDSIVELATKYLALARKMNSLLDSANDSLNSLQPEKVNNLLTNQLSFMSREIDRRISFLQKEYNQELETNFMKSSRALSSNSQFFLWISFLFIFFGLILTYRNIMSIVKPIDALLGIVGNIRAGNYEKRVSIKGTDELSMLGNAFNQMSDSLQNSFDEIKLKNKELEHFVYIASHDLQEPLRTINSFTELLEKEYTNTLGENANTYIQFISKASTRMSLLVRGLLDYSRIGVNKELSLVNCNELFEAITIDLADLIKNKNARLEMDVFPVISAYETELKILFHHLIVNAIKFQRPNESPVVEIRVIEEKNNWKFMIFDNGIGIKVEHRKKIFAMFHRLNPKKEYAGIGIGLAFCLKIIEMHHGKIIVDSEVRKGSVFNVIISKNIPKKKMD